MAAFLTWRGERVRDRIFKVLERKNRQVTKLLRKQIEEALERKGWGSDPAGKRGKRIRRRHSDSGEVPYKQTGNYAKSIRTEVDTRGDQIIASVFTDVPYSQTLEFGGSFQMDQNNKKYSKIRLVNPFRSPIIITPRPVWIPVLRANIFSYKYQEIFDK